MEICHPGVHGWQFVPGPVFPSCALWWRCVGTTHALPAATMTRFPKTQSQPQRSAQKSLSHQAKDFSKLLCFLYHFLLYPHNASCFFFLFLHPHATSQCRARLSENRNKRGALIITISWPTGPLPAAPGWSQHSRARPGHVSPRRAGSRGLRGPSEPSLLGTILHALATT